ncbi:MAG: GHKL domain-containing protein [Lachnospiraceae bacterium]|nr:GHKL domain-containing protein [Lachnospiraceae bacterium]
MFMYIQGFCIVILEILCCKLFFETFAERRNENQKWRNRGIITGLIVATYFLAVLFQNYFLAKQFFIVIATSILMLAYVKVSIIKSLVIAGFFQGLVLIIDFACLILSAAIFKSVIVLDEVHFVHGNIFIVLTKSILFLGVMIIRKAMGEDSAYMLSGAEWLKYISFPIFTIGVIATLIATTGGIENHDQDAVLFAIAVGLAGLNVMIFYLLLDTVKRERKLKEAELYRLNIENKTESYRSIFESFDKQRKKTHEFNARLMCIEALVKKEKYEELKQYVDSIYNNLQDSPTYINTKNAIIDAVLNVKFEEIAAKNIAFLFEVNDLAKIKLCDEDIVVILTNLLNNAIEACDKCAGKKVIKLRFFIKGNDIIIAVKNTYENDIIIKEGKFLTTKTVDIEEHGLGIINIIDTIKKYNGKYVIRHEANEFLFSIVIPQA